MGMHGGRNELGKERPWTFCSFECLQKRLLVVAEAILVIQRLAAGSQRLSLSAQKEGPAHLFLQNAVHRRAQFEAYFHDSLWLRNACRHANKMASHLTSAISFVGSVGDCVWLGPPRQTKFSL
ncbi:hypothetical protein niasHT_032467 [Heterodera trifolii]|uniref:RNase H type-1 domain-containing protein n=1 Tax=Heterodera trifolii TaxID=157864 RepID=A0ABD2IH49_9BILA